MLLLLLYEFVCLFIFMISLRFGDMMKKIVIGFVILFTGAFLWWLSTFFMEDSFSIHSTWTENIYTSVLTMVGFVLLLIGAGVITTVIDNKKGDECG